ncbi:cornifelin homolog B-like [Diretmus argenteus]
MSSMVIRQPQLMSALSETDDWASGICDCCEDVPDCCFGLWCCPCHACKTTKAYGQCLCLPLLDIFGLIPPVTMTIRVSLRQRYGIKGNVCCDCLCATFCRSCVWCQMSRELKKRSIPTVPGDLFQH